MSTASRNDLTAARHHIAAEQGHEKEKEETEDVDARNDELLPFLDIFYPEEFETSSSNVVITAAGTLGISIGSTNSGVVVTAVNSGGSAAKAGMIQADDHIVGVNTVVVHARGATESEWQRIGQCMETERPLEIRLIRYSKKVVDTRTMSNSTEPTTPGHVKDVRETNLGSISNKKEGTIVEPDNYQLTPMYSYQMWTDSETTTAQIGLCLGVATGGNEQQRLRTAVTYWMQNARQSKEGLNPKRFPTIEEMKRFSEVLSTREEEEEEEEGRGSSGKGEKRKRTHRTTNCSDPSGNKEYLLTFPLTEAMINEKRNNGKYFVITNQTLKAYKKVFGWAVDNNKLRAAMISKVKEHTGEKTDQKR